MQKRENNIAFFLVFFTLSVLTIIVGRLGLLNGISSFLNGSSSFVRGASVNILSLKSAQNKRINELISENLKLKKDLIDKDNLLKENEALRAQFENPGFSSKNLLPAKVIGAPGFIPGLSNPEYLIIDKGEKNGVTLGSVVVVGSYLVGKVTEVLENQSKVILVINKGSSFTAKTKEGIIGILQGKGSDGMVFGNVLLSENLKKDGLVLTKGDKNEKGIGYPPDIVVGKIISIEKKSSDLFQKAQIRSFVDFTNLVTVFVILK